MSEVGKFFLIWLCGGRSRQRPAHRQRERYHWQCCRPAKENHSRSAGATSIARRREGWIPSRVKKAEDQAGQKQEGQEVQEKQGAGGMGKENERSHQPFHATGAIIHAKIRGMNPNPMAV